MTCHLAWLPSARSPLWVNGHDCHTGPRGSVCRRLARARPAVRQCARSLAARVLYLRSAGRRSHQRHGLRVCHAGRDAVVPSVACAASTCVCDARFLI